MTSVCNLYTRMKSENDFTPILVTAIREVGVPPEKSEAFLDAFLQWFALIPQLKSGESLQMLKSVDRIWHAFILNTKLYRGFCQKYIGFYVDHDPLDSEDESLPRAEYARLTLSLLEDAFGAEVNPYLRLLEEGATCCMGCGEDAHSVRLIMQPVR
jgi:hypothetical protein